jgi:hypothetical protein
MGNSITANKNLVIQTYNTSDGTLPTTAVSTSGLTSGTAYTTWDVPENYNAAALDLILGGTATVSVTGASGTVALTADKYQPMAMLFTGTLTANVTYTIPSGVGGTWVVRNSTTGSYTITLSSLTAGASATFVVPQDGLPYTISLIAVSGGGFYVGTLTDGSITTAKIADSAVTTAKIADSAVTTAKLNNYSITNTKLLPSVINDLAAKTTLANADEFSLYDSAAVVAISTIILSGAGPTYTATATTAAAHGLSNGNSLTISGATGNTSVNGVFAITVTSTTQFTYTVTSGAAVTGSPVYTLNPGLKKITWTNFQTQIKAQITGRRYIGTRIITSGSGTYGSAGSITPTTGTTYIIVKGCGGGAGGGYASTSGTSSGGGAAGGGGGAFDPVGVGIDLTVGPITSIAYSVGSAGAGGVASGSTAATNGGATTFGTAGSYLSLGGGLAGESINTSNHSDTNGGLGGTATTGSTAASNGQAGYTGCGVANAFAVGGNGGSSPFGSGGIGRTSSAGGNAFGRGSGGGGGCGKNGSDFDGGAGTTGILVIEEYAAF